MFINSDSVVISTQFVCDVSDSEVPYFHDQTPRLLRIYFITRFTAATIRGRPLIEGGINLFKLEAGWSTVYAQRSFVSALGRVVLS